MTDAEKIIQDQLDGDITKRGTVAFQEFFGERCVAALRGAGLLLPQDAEIEYAQFDNGRFYMYAAPGSRRVTHARSVGPWLPIEMETENG